MGGPNKNILEGPLFCDFVHDSIVILVSGSGLYRVSVPRSQDAKIATVAWHFRWEQTPMVTQLLWKLLKWSHLPVTVDREVGTRS
jgi:hypothetical protein